MEDDLKLQDFDQWVKIFILKHEGGNLSKGSKISGQPNGQQIRTCPRPVHKRNKEGDQGGPWTPLEGPKIYFRRS